MNVVECDADGCPERRTDRGPGWLRVTLIADRPDDDQTVDACCLSHAIEALAAIRASLAR